MSEPRRECLGDLTWRETLGILSLSSGQPAILRCLLLGVGSWEGALWACPESRASTLWTGRVDNAPSAPPWMLSWINKIDFITLFSASELDCIKGVSFLICDRFKKEYWFGVAGGLEEVFPYAEHPDTQLSEIQPSPGQRLWKIPVCGRAICANDVYAIWSDLLQYSHDNLVWDLLGDCKVYDRDLIPPDHIKRFIMQHANTYIIAEKLGFNLWRDGPFVSVDELVTTFYPASDSPSND